MAQPRSAPAQEVLPTELSPCSPDELRLAQKPLAVLLDDLLARSVGADLEGITPVRRPANVDRPLDHRADLPGVEQPRRAHTHFPGSSPNSRQSPSATEESTPNVFMTR